MTAIRKITSSLIFKVTALLMLIVGVVLAVMFGVRFLHSLDRIRHAPFHPTTADVQDLRGWMTIPYISKTYGIPPQFFFQSLGVNPVGNERSSMDELNRQYYPGQPGIVLKIVRDTILMFQQSVTPLSGGGK